MSELRFDQTIGNWVVFAPSRLKRPHELARTSAADPPRLSSETDCPFCPGKNEQEREIFALRPSGGGPSEWYVRVIPNKYPALRSDESPVHRSINEHFESMGGCGAHELIIESPEHDRFLGRQPIEQIERVLRAAQHRYRELMRDNRFKAVIVFKNHGAAAGTSMRHPHWQIIATPVVPRMLRLRHAEAVDYFDRNGECLYCVLTRAEEEASTRIITQNDHYVAFVPFAAHHPFETWILPKRHDASFMSVRRSLLRTLAEVLKAVLMRLFVGLNAPAFNLTIDSAPSGDEDKEYFLWHIRIIPRLATAAGFELGSGMSINTVLPEEAAAYLRNLKGDEVGP